MLFLTSFDGSDIQYIEAFVRVVPARINGLYWGAKGFPGPKRFGPVASTSRPTATPSTTSGWPIRTASTTMVSQALKLQAAYDARAAAPGRRRSRALRSGVAALPDAVVQGLL